jgi:hypothetical protein
MFSDHMLHFMLAPQEQRFQFAYALQHLGEAVLVVVRFLDLDLRFGGMFHLFDEEPFDLLGVHAEAQFALA